jgi:hypothetical protein
MVSERLAKSLENLDREGLVAIILQQGSVIEELQGKLQELEVKLSERTRGSAGPFRIRDEKRKSEADKQRPGRKAGHEGKCQLKPEQVDEEVEAKLGCCPSCGGTLSGQQPIEQWLIDLPEVKPVVTKLTTYRAGCGQCGEVESVHPLKVSQAIGAAGVHLGANALGLAVSLSQQQD